MPSFRGSIPLAGVLLVAASATAARAERLRAFGFDFASDVWTVSATQGQDDQVVVENMFGTKVAFGVEAVRDGWTCDALLATAPAGATAQLPGLLAKERGVVMPQGTLVCRESRGRRIDVAAPVLQGLPPDAQQRITLLLVDEIDAGLAAQTSLKLARAGWDLGPYFARWQPRITEHSDRLYLVGPGEVATEISISRNPYAKCAGINADGAKSAKRPAWMPAAFGAQVLTGVIDGDQRTVGCIDSGAGRYEVEVAYTLGPKKKPDRKTEKSVTEILGAIAKAINDAPPIPDTVTEASEESSDDDEDDKPAITTPTPPTSTAPEPESKPLTEEQLASTSSSYSSDHVSTRGWYAESPVLMVRAHQLAFDATMTAEETDAIGGSIAVERPLHIEDFGGAEWSGAIGYDELGGISFDVRGGVGVWFARPMTLRLGAGIDGFRGTDTGGELPTEVYAYIGGEVPVGPVLLRAEYTPRNGGTDEIRARVSFTKLRDAGRKIVVAGDGTFFDGATVLSLGVGVGI